MVIKWDVASEPVVENRRIYVNKEGEANFRKTTGIGKRELLIIKDNIDEIVDLLTNFDKNKEV